MSISYLVSEYLVDESNPRDERLEVFAYYGSFTKTLLTMFEAWMILDVKEDAT